MAPKKPTLGTSPQHPLLAERAEVGRKYWGWTCTSTPCQERVVRPELLPCDPVWLECRFCGAPDRYSFSDVTLEKCTKATPPQSRLGAPRPLPATRQTLHERGGKKLYPKKP